MNFATLILLAFHFIQPTEAQLTSGPKLCVTYSNPATTTCNFYGSIADAITTLKAIRSLADYRSKSAPAVLTIPSGSYALTQPLLIDSTIANSEGKLSIVGTGANSTKLRGSKEIPYTGWTKVSGKNYYSANWTDVAYPKQLFYKEERQILARYPNLDPTDLNGGGYAVVGKSPSPTQGSTCDNRITPSTSCLTYRLQVPRIPGTTSWTNPTDGFVSIWSNEWAFNRAIVKSYDSGTGTVEIEGNYKDNTAEYAIRSLIPEAGSRFFISGIAEAMDVAKEWYFQSNASPSPKIFYYFPETPNSSNSPRIPISENIFKIINASHISITGLSIEETVGNGVSVFNSNDVVLDSLIVKNTGKIGAAIYSGTNNILRGSDISYTGESGVKVCMEYNPSNDNCKYSWDRRDLTPQNNQVYNNHVHHSGVIFKGDMGGHSSAGINISGVNNKVSNNLIHDTPYAGIFIGDGNENEISYNVLHHTNLEAADSGAIYSWVYYLASRGNKIRYNFIYHVGGFASPNSSTSTVSLLYPYYTWGIYLDDNSPGFDVQSNIVLEAPTSGIFIHGSQDIKISKNHLIDTPAFYIQQKIVPMITDNDPTTNDWWDNKLKNLISMFDHDQNTPRLFERYADLNQPAYGIPDSVSLDSTNSYVVAAKNFIKRVRHIEYFNNSNIRTPAGLKYRERIFGDHYQNTFSTYVISATSSDLLAQETLNGVTKSSISFHGNFIYKPDSETVKIYLLYDSYSPLYPLPNTAFSSWQTAGRDQDLQVLSSTDSPQIIAAASEINEFMKIGPYNTPTQPRVSWPVETAQNCLTRNPASSTTTLVVSDSCRGAKDSLQWTNTLCDRNTLLCSRPTNYPLPTPTPVPTPTPIPLVQKQLTCTYGVGLGSFGCTFYVNGVSKAQCSVSRGIFDGSTKSCTPSTSVDVKEGDIVRLHVGNGLCNPDKYKRVAKSNWNYNPWSVTIGYCGGDGGTLSNPTE